MGAVSKNIIQIIWLEKINTHANRSPQISTFTKAVDLEGNCHLPSYHFPTI